VLHRGQASQVRPDGVRLVVRELVEHGHRGRKRDAIGAQSVSERPRELLLGPSTKARVAVRREIGAQDRPARRVRDVGSPSQVPFRPLRMRLVVRFVRRGVTAPAERDSLHEVATLIGGAIVRPEHGARRVGRGLHGETQHGFAQKGQPRRRLNRVRTGNEGVAGAQERDEGEHVLVRQEGQLRHPWRCEAPARRQPGS
jgi:hypothetical protein